MSKLLANYEQKKRDIKDAKYWNNLPNGEKYGKSSFKIYGSRSRAPLLTRLGQQYAGGTNCWESPKALNEALLEVIIRRQDELISEAIGILEEEEKEALKDCQVFIDEMQKKINEAG